MLAWLAEDMQTVMPAAATQMAAHRNDVLRNCGGRLRNAGNMASSINVGKTRALRGSA